MKKKSAIIIFSRAPVAGHTKTRMMPYLSPDQCAKLHINFLKDIYGECKKINADIFVSYTPENTKSCFENIFFDIKEYILQTGEDLGKKMYNAIKYVLDKNYDTCILIGTDIPEIRLRSITKAFDILNSKDIVFGPTFDGGYYLVGMKKPIYDIFDNKIYGGGNVLSDSVKPLEEKGFKIGYTDILHDMDTKFDIISYRNRMRTNKILQKSYTGKYLIEKQKISVIIPVYNEEKTILKMKEQLMPYKNDCEIIFADGGSTDQTLSLIGKDFLLINTDKGRAKQMNAGAEKSNADILFFLHCDSELPKNFLKEIKDVMKNHEVGCFGIKFHSKQILMKICALISNHRIKDRKVIFGDQGIFITRELFFSVGMFPDIPIMEDYQFSLTLKKLKIKIGMTKHKIYTSDRRFPKNIILQLKLMWKMNRLRKMYRDNVSIDIISSMYEDIR